MTSPPNPFAVDGEAAAAQFPDEAVVSLEGVEKIYSMGAERVHALDGVSMDFRAGSYWAIMGPSGSGKSTLLNLLGCLDVPSVGRYLLRGHDVGRMNDDDLSEIRLQHIGFIFQSFNLVAQLSVRENIELPLYYQGWEAPDSAARAGELAELVGLGTRLHHRPSELSGGQQQRVAVARALANDPDIILADEPTGNLDTHTGGQILDLLTDLHERGKTILMVTHEPDVAARASHQLHLKDGRVDRVEGRT